MRTSAGMAAVRAWHPVRLALVCAVLTMAGGAPAARAVYAEVSARAVAATRADAHDRALQPLADAAAPSKPPLPRVFAPPAEPVLAIAPRYLAHCALLL